MNRCREISLIVLTLAFAAPSHAAVRSETHPFQGITLIHRVETSPRNLDINIALIDLLAPGIRFKVTPDNGDLPGDVVSQTPRQFVTQQDAQLGINGDFSSFVSGGNRDVNSFAASDGIAYSPFSTFEPAFNVAKNNVWTAIAALNQTDAGKATPNPAVPVWNAIGGYSFLVQNGNLPTYWDNPDDYRYQFAHQLHPRTVIGMNAARTQAILFTVDGRQAHSGGMTFPEMGAVLKDDYGMAWAINLDGGGSTQFVLSDPTPRVINRPSDGSERLVGNNLAVFARPAPPPVPADAQTANLQEQAGVYTHGGTHIRSLEPTRNLGGNAAVRVGYDSAFGNQRSLFSFDLSRIPAGSTIHSVYLDLDCFDVNGATGNHYVDMELYELLGGFDENQATWNERRPGVAWSTPGGDFEGEPLSTLVAQNSTGLKRFVSTVDFLAAAQAALNQDRPLDLIIVALGTEDFASNLEARFRADDATTGARPLLSIAYTPIPEPCGLVVTALAAFAISRRRAIRAPA